MLLNHTSGIPDSFGALSLTGSLEGVPDSFSSPHSPSEIFAMMPSRDPTFEPGSNQRYSNTNGLLVGEVIEAVTGRSLGDVFEERIVARLGLNVSYLYEEKTFDRPRARGYCGSYAPRRAGPGEWSRLQRHDRPNGEPRRECWSILRREAPRRSCDLRGQQQTSTSLLAAATYGGPRSNRPQAW
jgi:CubicO group peptidase (beta-lactamase class C family)